MSRATVLLLPFAFSCLISPLMGPALAARTGARPIVRVSAFTYRADDATILLPMQGPVPRWALYAEPRGKVAFMEVPAGPGMAEFMRRTQALNPEAGIAKRILVANNRPGIVRIAARGRVPIRFYPKAVRQEGDRWLLEVHILPVGQQAPQAPVRAVPHPTPLPAPRPRPHATPSPVPSTAPSAPPLPPSPAPSATPSPEVTLPPQSALPASLPVATPTPGPTPEPEGPEPRSYLSVPYRLGDYAEDYAVGGSHNVKVPGNTAWAVSWLHRWSDAWSSRANLDLWAPYTIIDVDMQGSQHTRQETSGSLSGYWNTQVWGQSLSLGGGWWGRQVSVQNTVTPLVQSYLFSQQQIYTGPQLEALTTVRLWGPLRAIAAAQVRPLVMPVFDADVDSAGLLLGAGGEAGLELAWKSFALRGTYRMETLRSPDFTTFGQDLGGWNLGVAYRY